MVEGCIRNTSGYRNRSNKDYFLGAYHANFYQRKDTIVITFALLPLFHEKAHSVAMIRHSMNIVRNAVDHINSGHIPVIRFDQP